MGLRSSFPVPENEPERLKSLFDLGLQDSTGSPEFDAVASLAADVLECPIALFSLLGEDEQWFKAKCGLDTEMSPRQVAFCNYTILGRDPLIVNDAREDDRFKENPLVCGDPKVVFYAGAPLSIDGVHNLGTLCVIDTQPRQMTALQMKRLHSLARTAEGLLRAYTSRQQAERARERETEKARELARTASLLEQVTKLSGVGGWELELEPRALTWTNETKRIHDVALDFEPKLDQAIEFYGPDARPVITAAVEEAMKSGSSWDLELPMVTAEGRDIWVRAVGSPTYKNGSMVSLIGAFQDITERRRNETRIRESEAAAHARSQELRTILDTMEEGVSVFDAASNLIVWNQKYIDIFDKTPGEVRAGVPLRRLLEFEKTRGDFPGDIDAHLGNLYHQLGQGRSVECQFRTTSGKIINSTHAPLPGGGWVGTHSDVTAQVLEAERIEYASRHDPLTGLPNRLAFNARLDAIKTKRNPKNQSLVLMMLDLDNFKDANDSFGHLAGDALLACAARRLRDCARKSDLVARLGGDEFAIVIECDQSETYELAEEIALSVIQRMQRPFEIDGNITAIGVSIGVHASPADDFEVDTIMRNADSALYRVKNQGRGGYEFYDQEPAPRAFAAR
ncbi:MAG: diguanylate cyclase [Paracoccaceae bacterium]|nr:diguanylate cyclase [Paracoccaceae bacterium]